MGPISYTQAALFAACPARYKAERVDKMFRGESLPMAQGSFAHEVLEAYGERVLAEGGGSRPDLVGPIFEQMWPASGLPAIVKNETLRLCEEAARQVVLHRENVVGVEVRAAVDVTGALVDYDAPTAAVRGRLDILAVQGGADGPALEVSDYKTGRLIVRIKEDRQLPLYLALARASLPQATSFIGKLIYPRHKAIRTHEFKAADLDGALAWALEIRNRIEDCLESVVPWAATPGAACADCPLFHACETRKTRSAQQVQVPTTDEDAADLIIQAGMLERQLSELREVLKLYIEANGSLSAGGLIADIKGQRREEYPLGPLKAVLAQHGLPIDKFLKGDNRAIKKAIIRYPGLGDDLRAIAKDKTISKLDIRRVGVETTGESNED